MAGGPLGAIVGGLLGNMFDASSEAVKYSSPQNYDTYRGDPRVKEFVFISSLVSLLTSVAKADREIHPSEVTVIKDFFAQNFHYTGHDGRVIENLIREAAGRKLDIRGLCEEMRKTISYPEQLMILRILYIIALSDRVFKESEQKRIQEIVDYMRIGGNDHDYIKKEFSIKDFDGFYSVLGITPDATDKEVKDAYREMVRKYHPDKVEHLGKDFVGVAKEKFQNIQQAYDKIAQERNL